MSRRLAIAGGALLICAHASAAQAQSFTFEALFGSAYNFATPLTVHQDGFPDIEVSAQYDTKPFGPHYPYYSWRFGYWNKAKDQAWELRQVHHRLFLSNNPPEIQVFAIHFGYNFFMAGHAWKRRGFVYHVAGGVLICNPESTIRGRKLETRGRGIFDQGYELSGVGAEFAVSREFAIDRHLFAVGNGGVMMGRGSVPVADGSADVPNVSLHGQIGLGFRF